MGKFGLLEDEEITKAEVERRKPKDTWSLKPFPKSPAKPVSPRHIPQIIKPVYVEPVKIIQKNKIVDQQAQDTLDLISKLEKNWLQERETQDREAQDQRNAVYVAKSAQAKADFTHKNGTVQGIETPKTLSPVNSKISTPQEQPKTSLLPGSALKPQADTILPKSLRLDNSAKSTSPKTMNQLKPESVQPPTNTQSNQPPREVGTKSALETSAAILQKLEHTKNLKKSLPSQFQNQLLRDKMKINRTVGQLTNSQKKLVPLIKDLNLLFTSNQDKPEYYQILLYLCAKKIVKQAEMEISVKQESCFPIGILSVHLSTKHPDFNKLLLGRMMKKCPYVIPCYPRKQLDESKEVYQARLGYKMKGTNAENEIQFGERMCGIIKLYAAIVQTNSIANSYGIENGWTWLARILNMKPRKLTPLLIHGFLNVAGHALVTAYTSQMIKVMKCLLDDFIPLIPTQALPSTTKLKLFLEETIMVNDSPLGHNLSRILSRTIPGSHQEKSVDEEEPEINKPPEEAYKVSGSFINSVPLHLQTGVLQVPATPGRMIETGDRIKDSGRKEAIEKIPVRKSRPSWVAETTDDKAEAMRLMLESDIIVYDVFDNAEEAATIISGIDVILIVEFAEKIDSFEKPKTFILISSVITWAKTKVESDDLESPIPEDEYRRRKPHPNYKALNSLEKDIVKYSKKEKFRGYVIAPGLVYHSGDSIFHFFIKQAWHNAAALDCYENGENILPCIHLDDLVTVVVEVIEALPETRYILAIDDSKNSLFDIVKCISKALSNGAVKKVSKEEAFLNKNLSQQYYDMFTLNIRLEPVWTKDYGIEFQYGSGIIENITRLVQEFRDARGLWPIKLIMHGPPASGKTFYAKEVAKKYNLHYLEPEEIFQEAIANLERRIVTAPDSDDYDPEADKELLAEIKEAINNTGKPTIEHIMEFVREKLKTSSCKNQGYVLDGYPNLIDEAKELFKALTNDSKDESKNDEFPNPEFVFTIEASDNMIKERLLNLPESSILAARQSGEVLINRLEEFRKQNTDELTVLNFFDEMEVGIINLQAEVRDANQILAQIFKSIGEPRGYGKSAEEIVQELKEEEAKRVELELLRAREIEEKQLKEAERLAKKAADLEARKEQIAKEERDILEAQTLPLRDYLIKFIMPTLSAGLAEVAKVRPDDPIDFLAEFLFKTNPANKSE